MEQKNIEMNREKQIEEMREKIRTEISKAVEGGLITWTEFADWLTEHLHTAGYRKQSDGEWRSELVKRCDWKGKEQQYYQPNSCSLCHEAVLKRTQFCPNCGAKMKGGVE